MHIVRYVHVHSRRSDTGTVTQEQVTVDIVRDGGRRNVGVRTCAVWPLPWNSSLTHRHSRAQPPPLQSSRAAATAAWRAPRPALCNRQQRRLLVHAARARASRRRAPQAAATAPIISMSASATALHPCAIGCSHATWSVGAATRARARRYYTSTALAAFSGVLYAYAMVQCACAAAARRGWRQRTRARTATHSCAASRE